MTLNGLDDFPHCTCPAFRYFKNGFEKPYEAPTCKHIARVFQEACLYDAQQHSGNDEVKLLPIETHPQSWHMPRSCPNCGGRLVPVKIAV